MSLSTFRINQPPGTPYANWDRARRDIALGTVEGEAQNKSQTSYKWEMLSAPLGVTVVINNSTTHTCNFTLATRGSYLLRLTVNEGLPLESITTILLAVPLVNSGLCLPALNETNQDNSLSPYDGNRGHEDKANAFFRLVDTNTIVENLKTAGTSGMLLTAVGGGLVEMRSNIVTRATSPNYIKPTTDADTFRAYNGAAYGELSATAVTFSGSGSVTAGSSSDLSLGARGSSINLNSATDTALVGFTKTSIIGALNELKTEVGGGGLWTRATGAINYVYPTNSGDVVDCRAEIKMYHYSAASEPTLGADQHMAFWTSTVTSQTFLLFRKPGGTQVSVELA